MKKGQSKIITLGAHSTGGELSVLTYYFSFYPFHRSVPHFNVLTFFIAANSGHSPLEGSRSGSRTDDFMSGQATLRRQAADWQQRKYTFYTPNKMCNLLSEIYTLFNLIPILRSSFS